MVDFAMFNTLDYVVFTIIIISTFFAIIRGFIGSFLSLAGWMASIYLAYYLFPQVKPLIEEKFHITNQLVVLLGGHTVLLLAFLIIFGIFNVFAATAVSALTKGFFDRSLGAAFGIVRGALIVSFFFLITSTTLSVFHGKDDKNSKNDEQLPTWITKAQSYAYLKMGKAMLSEFIPDSFHSRIEETYADISKKSLDQRFLESSIDKLDKHLPNDVKQHLSTEKPDASLSMSQEDYELKHAQDLLDAYKVQGKEGVSADEIKRLEKIIDQYQSKEGHHPEEAVKP
jgi:membrane protein required for colicin V production